MASASTSQNDNDLLVGRATELNQFKVILAERKPTLITLLGKPGSGKTSLLKIVQQQAAAAGWNTAPPDDLQLPVGPETTDELFTAQLRNLITAPSERSFIEKLTKSAADPGDEFQVLVPVIEQMRARAPFLLLIDGFAPADAFATWFQNRFLSDMRATGAPVVVVIAARLAVPGLEEVTDHVIQLRAIDLASIREHFMMLADKVTPRIEAAELEIYVNTAHRRPDLLNSLTRVLSLADESVAVA